MISVVIPVYNTQGELRRCLDSVLNQSLADFELILVDDGSTDDSPHICDEYANRDSRIKVQHQQNKGVSNARNAGILHSTGDFITFIDSDDWVEANHLEMLKGKIEGAELSMTGIIQHSDNKVSMDAMKGNECTDLKSIIELCTRMGSTCNCLFRSDIIKGQGIMFDTGMDKGEDSDFLMRYAQYVGKACCTDSATYHYMIDGKDKEHMTPKLLYSMLKLHDDMLRLTIPLPTKERQFWIDKEMKEGIDYAIDGLLLHIKTSKSVDKELIGQYMQTFQPNLSLSTRQTLRHRLFRLLCRSNNISTLTRQVKTVIKINSWLKPGKTI